MNGIKRRAEDRPKGSHTGNERILAETHASHKSPRDSERNQDSNPPSRRSGRRLKARVWTGWRSESTATTARWRPATRGKMVRSRVGPAARVAWLPLRVAWLPLRVAWLPLRVAWLPLRVATGILATGDGPWVAVGTMAAWVAVPWACPGTRGMRSAVGQ